MKNYKKLFENSVIVSLHKVNHKSYLKHNELLNKYDLTVQQSRILIYIITNRNNKKINQKDLETHLELKGSSISSLVKNMIEKGLIIKSQNDTDGRYFNIDITEKGIALDKIAVKIFKDYEMSLVKGISEEDLINFKKILNIIENNIES